LAKAMRIGDGWLQTMTIQAATRSKTAPMTLAAITPERDFGPRKLRT
jgi:hypothetical protein